MLLDVYSELKKLAEEAGYSKLTDLQEQAFSDDKIDTNQWMFVIGDTSSGKTLIPLLVYFRDYLHSGNRPKMLFAVPFRALAAQKHQELSRIAEKLGLSLSVVQCTGEFRQNDVSVLNAERDVDIVVIIYEKAFLFVNLNQEFLEHYQYLVLDEIGLTQNVQRGIKADFLLCRAAACRSPLRVIALGTPFYDWSSYTAAYDFRMIRAEARPVELKTFPIFAIRGLVFHTEKGCVPITEGEFWVETGANWTFSLVERICQYHLTQNHRILVFLNDREQVRQLSQFLTHRLREQGLLTQWITPKQCCEIICSNMNITEFERENVLYHIMEEEDFEAISYGIGFHNANLYYPIRAYIENEILESDGHLRIVCCTETLAYGINSNVDVVIIPQMIKNRPELGTSGFLFPNEYMNYAGRAGRLQEGCESGKTRYGYVYPVINSPYVFDDSSQHLQKYRKNLERVHIKTASKIIADMMTARKITSSLS